MQINIEKREAFVIFLGLLIIGASISVYAFESFSNPITKVGHSLNEIQGYFQDDSNLRDSFSKLCKSNGTDCKEITYTFDCKYIERSYSDKEVGESCPDATFGGTILYKSAGTYGRYDYLCCKLVQHVNYT